MLRSVAIHPLKNAPPGRIMHLGHQLSVTAGAMSLEMTNWGGGVQGGERIAKGVYESHI